MAFSNWISFRWFLLHRRIFCRTKISRQKHKLFSGLHLNFKNLSLSFFCLLWILGKQPLLRVTFDIFKKVHYDKVGLGFSRPSVPWTLAPTLWASNPNWNLKKYHLWNHKRHHKLYFHSISRRSHSWSFIKLKNIRLKELSEPVSKPTKNVKINYFLFHWAQRVAASEIWFPSYLNNF